MEPDAGHNGPAGWLMIVLALVVLTIAIYWISCGPWYVR